MNGFNLAQSFAVEGFVLNHCRLLIFLRDALPMVNVHFAILLYISYSMPLGFLT